LTGSSGDEHYARGVLWIEAAEIVRAQEAFQAAANGESAAVRIAADYWLGQLSPSPPAKQGSSAP
jgi:hypothetical protein